MIPRLELRLVLKVVWFFVMVGLLLAVGAGAIVELLLTVGDGAIMVLQSSNALAISRAICVFPWNRHRWVLL